MTKEENLDFILSITKEYTNDSNIKFRKWYEDQKKIQKQIEDFAPAWPLTKIYFKHLLDEKMVEVFYPESGKSTECYRATFKGCYYKGYVQEIKDYEAANKASIQCDKAVFALNKRLNKATWIAAFVGIGLFVMEVLKYCRPPLGDSENIVKQIGIFFLILLML